MKSTLNNRFQQSSQGLSPGRQQHQQSSASAFSASQNVSQLKMLRQQQQQQAAAQQVDPKMAQIQRQVEMRKLSGPEFCTRHNEPNVGYLVTTREVVCNSCIFEKKLMAVKFTALVTKELRNEFNAAFSQYKNGLNSVNGVDANLVRQQATVLVQNFFAQIRERVKMLQRQSMAKIQQSDSLRELERIIEQSKEFFPEHTKTGDHFEREKRLFDEKIGKGRFAYLVKRQEFYHDLISSLEKSSDKMKMTLERSSEQMNRVLRLRQNDSSIRHKINEMVSDCIDVDMNSVGATASSVSHPKMPSNSTNQPVSQQQAQATMQSPRNTDYASNYADASSNFNSSMQRDSFPQLGSAVQPQQQFSAQRVSEQLANSGTFTLGNNLPPEPRQPSSLSDHHATFSPIKTGTETEQQQAPSAAGNTQIQACKQDLLREVRPGSSKEGKDADDCVVVTSVVRPQHQPGPNRIEHSFQSTFKLKGQILLKLIPGKGWVKIKEMNGLMLAKVVQTLDEAAYIVGGSQDRNSQQTLSQMVMFQVRNGVVHTERKAEMLQSRSSHGCTINTHRDEIYVAGGYHMGELTSTSEAYCVQTDTWRPLPPLNESKCSVTLCTLNGRYLYCLGGLTKQESGAFLLGSIEVLDLEASHPKWLMLSVKMPNQVCDVGAIPLNATDLLIYGGWNKNSTNTAFIIRLTVRGHQQLHSFHPVSAQMDKNDFSMISGVAMKTDDPDVIKVCCHAFLFSYDLKTNAFVTSSSM